MDCFKKSTVNFNTRCFATGQTIAENDEVVIFPIFQMQGYVPTTVVTGTDEHGLITEEVRHPSEFSHPHALWVPLGCALRGTYDGSGRFKLTKSEFNRKQLIELYSEMAKITCITPSGSNPYREKGFTLPSLPELCKMVKVSENNENPAYLADAMHLFFELLQEAVGHNRVFISTRHSTTFRYGYSSVLKFAVASARSVSTAGPTLKRVATQYLPDHEFVNTLEAYRTFTLTIKQWRADALRDSSVKDLDSLIKRLKKSFGHLKNWPSGSFACKLLQESLLDFDKSTKLEYVVKELAFYFKYAHSNLFSISETTNLVALEKMFVNSMVSEILAANILHGENALSPEFLQESESQLEISDFIRTLKNTVQLFSPMVQLPVCETDSTGQLYTAWALDTAIASAIPSA